MSRRQQYLYVSMHQVNICLRACFICAHKVCTITRTYPVLRTYRYLEFLLQKFRLQTQIVKVKKSRNGKERMTESLINFYFFRTKQPSAMHACIVETTTTAAQIVLTIHTHCTLVHAAEYK